MHFTRTKCTIEDEKGGCVLEGLRTPDNCYGFVPNSSTVCKSARVDDAELWHQRLGHLNFKNLARITGRELVRGVPKIGRSEPHVYGPCQLGKQVRSSHKKTNHIATTHCLELLHMDLMGPTRTESLGGKRYILVLVDDYSCYTWVDFMREKSETCELVKRICQRVQNEKGFSITQIRSDHGREFDFSELEAYCDEIGITYQFSTPKTPQQNGVDERKNRVIQEMARVMLHGKKVARHF